MVYKSLLFLIFLMLSSVPNVFASLGESPCYEVKNPEHYKDFVTNSDVSVDFQEWQLKNITIQPCQSGGALIQVVLWYDIPRSYSPHNLMYSTEVAFYVINDKLHNSDELLQFYKNYKSYVHEFENNSAIEFFIETTNVTKAGSVNDSLKSLEMNQLFTLRNNQYLFSWDKIPGDDNEKLKEYLNQNFDLEWVKSGKIEKIDGGKAIKVFTENNSVLLRIIYGQTYMRLTIDNYSYEFPVMVKEEDGMMNIYNKGIDYLNYNFIKGSIDSFQFENPKLIRNLDLFLPNITKIPQIEEFKRNKRIKYMAYGNERLVLRSDAGSLTYDTHRNITSSYILYNDFKWETFPEIAKAHSIIKEKLLVGELSNCSIGTGYAYGYTQMEYYNLNPSYPLSIKVALKCDEGTKRKEAFIKLNSNGTYERLEIWGSHPNQKENPIIIPVLILLVLISVLFFIVKSIGKAGKGKFLRPTKWKVIAAILITILEEYSLNTCYMYDATPCGSFAPLFWIISFPLYIILEPIGDILSRVQSSGFLFLILLLLVPFLFAYIGVCFFVWLTDKFRKK